MGFLEALRRSIALMIAPLGPLINDPAKTKLVGHVRDPGHLVGSKNLPVRARKLLRIA